MEIAIIGAGASGLACAIETMREAKRKKQKLSVTLFESNERVGKKLLATGNGRCNMTNLDKSLHSYFGKKSFYSTALEVFPPESNIEFFQSLGLYTKADSEGRVYPLSNQASSVLDALRFECERSGVNFHCGETVERIDKRKGKYIINAGQAYDKVVLACGGKSAVKQHNGYELLTSLGHTVTKTMPSLVKLTTSSPVTKQLKGIRAAVKMTLLSGTKAVAQENGELLFSDSVLSGIAAMQLSAHFARNPAANVVRIDFVPSMDYDCLVDAIVAISKNAAETKAENLLSGFMPKKIGTVIVKVAGVSPESLIGSLTVGNIKSIAALCKKFDFKITGTKGYGDAQVTAGGANTDEFDARTMQSKKHKGLYCCGELLDVDALCGGFNLQWAWSSGRLCGKSVISGE